LSFFPYDRDILTSSLWANGTPEAFKVWSYLLLTAEIGTGCVTDADPAIALHCGLSLEVTVEVLKWLSEPDPHSRTKDHDGRRIERLPGGGFRVLNFLARQSKDYSTPRVRRWRDRKRGETTKRVTSLHVTTDTDTDTTNTPKPPKGAVPSTEAVTEVFEHWRKVMGHPTAKQTPGRRRHILARLKEGYTVAQLCEAVDGCRLSLWHMGANESQAVFDDLTLICRSGEKVEKFREKAKTKPSDPEGTRGGLLTVEEQDRRRKEQWAKS